MSRIIATGLTQHLDGGVTTLCRLLKITLADGVTVTGATTLDQPVTYDGVVYSAIRGMDSSAIASDSSFNVENSEATVILSTDPLQGITREMVLRGELEGATWELLLVNYKNLAAGHIILDAGDVGEVRIVKNQVYIPELVSFAYRLKQSIGGVDSRKCRAIFGNQEQGQLYCGVDAEALFVTGTVTAVSSGEPKRAFAGDQIVAPPGRVQWLSGDNTSGKLYQIDGYDVGLSGMSIFEPMPFPIQVGDTYQVRPDCDKTLTTCRDVYSNMIEFRGEPLIPVGEATQMPGAGLP